MRATWAIMTLLLAVCLPCHRHLSAASIYATGFEDPPFHAGQPLAGQDGWTAGYGETATISPENPSDGLQDFRVLGSDLDPFILGNVLANYYSRKFNVDVAAEGYPRIHIEADIRLDGPQTADEYFNVSISASTGVASSGILLGSDGLATTAGLDAVPIPFSLGQYNHCTIDLNLGHQNIYTLRVNGELLASQSFRATSIFESVQFGCHSTSPSADSMHRDPAAYTVYIDNLSITTTIPEPSAFWIEGAGIIGIVAVGRSQRCVGTVAAVPR